MKIKVQGTEAEIIVVQPYYKKEFKDVKTKDNHFVKDEFGKKLKSEKDKFIKEMHLKVWMEIGDIGPYGEYVGTRGRIVKGRCMLFNKATDTYYKVAHTAHEIQEAKLIRNRPVIGYKY